MRVCSLPNIITINQNYTLALSDTKRGPTKWTTLQRQAKSGTALTYKTTLGEHRSGASQQLINASERADGAGFLFSELQQEARRGSGHEKQTIKEQVLLGEEKARIFASSRENLALAEQEALEKVIVKAAGKRKN